MIAKEKKQIAVVDSQILIWGLRRDSSPGQEEKIRKAERFLDFLQENYTVIVPAVVLGEILVKVPNNKRLTFIKKIFAFGFSIKEYSMQAASEYARLWQDKSVINEANGSSMTKPRHYRPDMMILATALDSGADIVFTEDRKLTKFASDYITVNPIPEVPSQQENLDLE